MSVDNPHIYEFGNFRLDLARRLLLRRADNQPVKLTAKAFDTLSYMVRHSGTVLDKDELMRAVWPDTVVEENNLSQSVSALRRALGEKQGENRYIATVPGRGFSFVAEVRIGVSKGDGLRADSPEDEIGGSRKIVEDKDVPQTEDFKPETPMHYEASADDFALPPGQRDVPTPSLAASRRSAAASALIIPLMLIVALAISAYLYVNRSQQVATDKAPINSVAVLPFANGGADPEVEALSEGISESLIDRLSELPQLKVIARGSSFKYKGREADPQEVARALGVAALVTGRVVRRGETLVVRVELVDARDRTQIWGGQYNRRAEDLSALQAEISGEIAERLRLRLTTGERQRIARREIVNPEAYELLLRGRFSRSKGGAENWKRAAEYYLRAIAVDPAYAPAYAELAFCYLNLAAGSILDPKEFTLKAEAAARKALELDEGLISAHIALAALKRNAWDWGAAEQEYQRAFELNPNHVGAHFGYASYLSLMGRHEQAIAEAKHARELDPLTPRATSTVANVHYFARQYDQAINFSMKTLELDPTSSGAHLILGYTYAAKGMNAEAIAAYEEAIKLGGDSSATQIFLGAAYAQAGEHERARTILLRLEASKGYVSPGELAVLYGALGERERAFTSLERAYAGQDLQLQFLKADPAFDPLRSDPRFIDLMRRV